MYAIRSYYDALVVGDDRLAVDAHGGDLLQPGVGHRLADRLELGEGGVAALDDRQPVLEQLGARLVLNLVLHLAEVARDLLAGQRDDRLAVRRRDRVPLFLVDEERA